MSTLDDVNTYAQSIIRTGIPDAQAWANAIDAGSSTWQDLVDDLVGSTDYPSVTGVVRLYQGIFDRVPDPGGLDFWLGHFRNFLSDGQGDFRTDLEQLITLGNWMESDEFIDTYGDNPTDEEFVTLLYQNVLQRDPDAEGLAYWVGVLQSTNNRERMVVDFTESVEFRNTVDPEIQATLHTAAKVAVGQDVRYDLDGGPYLGRLFNDAPHDAEGSGLNIDEDAGAFRSPGVIIPLDFDGNEFFDFEILSQSVPVTFSILDGEIGKIFLEPGAMLDYESLTSHDITVQITDRAGNTYVEDFTIQINDVPEVTLQDFSLVA